MIAELFSKVLLVSVRLFSLRLYDGRCSCNRHSLFFTHSSFRKLLWLHPQPAGLTETSKENETPIFFACMRHRQQKDKKRKKNERQRCGSGRRGRRRRRIRREGPNNGDLGRDDTVAAGFSRGCVVISQRVMFS